MKNNQLNYAAMKSTILIVAGAIASYFILSWLNKFGFATNIIIIIIYAVLIFFILRWSFK